MSEPVTAPDAAPATPAADPAAPKAPAPSRAQAALAAFRAKRAAVPAPAAAAPAAPVVPGDPAAPAIPAEIADAAKRWNEHLKAETARIAAASEGLSDEDKALIAGVPDVGMKAKILERLKSGAEGTNPPKEKAKPRAAGGPPSASTVDFSAALKDPQAMADAKARDPAGLKAFLSRAMNGSASRSTLDRGRA